MMMMIERYPSCFVLLRLFMARVTQDGWEWARCTLYLNPLPPMSDQQRSSPYNINTISSIKVMGIKSNIN